jgi:hypothetical protein
LVLVAGGDTQLALDRLPAWFTETFIAIHRVFNGTEDDGFDTDVGAFRS